MDSGAFGLDLKMKQRGLEIEAFEMIMFLPGQKEFGFVVSFSGGIGPRPEGSRAGLLTLVYSLLCLPDRTMVLSSPTFAIEN